MYNLNQKIIMINKYNFIDKKTKYIVCKYFWTPGYFFKYVYNAFQKFLLLDELEQETGLDVAGMRPKPSDCFIKVSGITAKWDKVGDKLLLLPLQCVVAEI